jgi:hypothetical protein
MILALNAAYPVPEIVSTLIQIANFEAYNVAVNASVLSSEIIPDLIKKAYLEAIFIRSKIGM